MKNLIRPALVLFGITSVVTGLLYPLAVTGVAQVVYPEEANGSLIHRGHDIVGSALIGQNFSGPNYFWSRPSATSPMPYNAANSGGSNLGPTNPALVDAVKGRVQTLRDAHPGKTGDVPIDLVTTSASGLDPHISPAAAEFQVERIAKARGIDADSVRALVNRFTESPQWGLFGDPRVNVLRLNLALDAMQPN